MLLINRVFVGIEVMVSFTLDMQQRVLFQTNIDYRRIDKSNWKNYHFSVGENTGNLMFTASLQGMLEASDYEVFVDHVKWENLKNYCSQNLIDKVIVNCSNWIRPSNVRLLETVARATQNMSTPIFMIGLGVQCSKRAWKSWKFEELASCDNAARQIIRNVNFSGGAIGARGRFTRDYLVGLEHSSCIKITGCPSILQFDFTDIKKIKSPSINKEIQIGVNGNLLLDDWPSIEAQFPNCKFLCQDWGLKMLFFPEAISRADISRFLAMDDHYRQVFNSNQITAFDSIDDWKRWIHENLNLMIGGRIHGGLIALFAGVPTLFINHDSRLAEFIELYKLPSLDRNELEGLEAVLSGHDWSETVAALEECKENYVRFFEENELQLCPGIRPPSGVKTTVVRTQFGIVVGDRLARIKLFRRSRVFRFLRSWYLFRKLTESLP